MKSAPLRLLGAVVLATNVLAAGAQPLAVLHTFSAPSNTNLDGSGPAAEPALSGNVLYGASSGGANGSGTNNYGTIFSLNSDGSGFTVLHTFSNPTSYIIGTNSLGLPASITVNSDGLMPRGNLILAGDTLYGAASGGGANGSGTVFSISPNGSNFTVLHAFATNFPAAAGSFTTATNSDGAIPNSLVLAGDTLFGTTEQGGTNGNGTIFSLNTNGNGFTVLHTLRTSDGKNPQSVLVVSGSTLYGTTALGGNGISGTVYSLSTNGANFTVLHNFTSGANAVGPYLSGLLIAGGRLYGTTVVGATNDTSAVFSMNLNGSNYRELYYLNNTSSVSAQPSGALLLCGDTLYGTSQFGGSNGFGQVFSINTNGGNFTTLYSFTKPHATNTDGCEPRTGLVLSGATLFGTAYFGGTGNGTIFSLPVATVVTNFHLAGRDLVFNGINGLAGHAYTVLANTNPAAPFNQWAPVATNVLSGGGNFTITATNALDPTATQQFYILRTAN